MGSFDKWSILVELGLFMGWLVEQEGEEYRIYIPPFLQEEEEISQADLRNTTCLACFKGKDRTGTTDIEGGTGKRKGPVFIAEVFECISQRQIDERLNYYQQYPIPEYWLVDLEKRVVYVYIEQKKREVLKYTFFDKIPVTIFHQKAEVDFREICKNCQEVNHHQLPLILEESAEDKRKNN